MPVRQATDEDVEAIAQLLEDGFERPDEARLFRALWESDDLATVLVHDGAEEGAPEEAGRGAEPARARGGDEDRDERGDPGGDERGDPGGDRGAEPERVDWGAASTQRRALAGVAVLSRLIEPEGALALGPIAVARDRRHQGLGKALIGASIDWARDEGHGAIFVLGQPQYYTRFGFSVEAARPFESHYPADFMMAVALRRGALEGGGELRYPPAFAALG